mmetsp:Transcript_11885/g.31979  ORF Transcript_11885/g.31979 Transcript_11885/m.31979 type:complete len:202 (-) Transcript_11885:587-1192(-)
MRLPTHADLSSLSCALLCCLLCIRVGKTELKTPEINVVVRNMHHTERSIECEDAANMESPDKADRMWIARYVFVLKRRFGEGALTGPQFDEISLCLRNQLVRILHSGVFANSTPSQGFRAVAYTEVQNSKTFDVELHAHPHSETMLLSPQEDWVSVDKRNAYASPNAAPSATCLADDVGSASALCWVRIVKNSHSDNALPQ